MSVKWMDAIKSFTDGVKQGVLTNNMKLIQDSLEEFMGEELAGMSVKEIDKEPDDEKEESLDVALQEVLDREDYKEDRKKKEEDDFTMSTTEKKTQRQRLSTSESLDTESKRNNQFIDDGTLGMEEAGSSLINDSAIPPVQRTRNPAKQQVDAVCYVCGKSEKVNPAQHREHYRCGACCKG